MYALGYENDLRSDEWIPSGETREAVAAFFENWVDQPAREDLPKKPTLLGEPTTDLHSVVLGCHIVAKCVTDWLSLRIGEAILGAIEAILATSLAAEVFPHRSHFSIIIKPAEGACHETVRVTLGEYNDVRSLIITHPPEEKLARDDESENWLVEAFAKCLVSIAVVTEPEIYFRRLGEEEGAFRRATSWRDLDNAICNILGNSQKQFLADWCKTGSGQNFPLRRTEPWSSGQATGRSGRLLGSRAGQGDKRAISSI